jgi:phosphosulfolactate synthase (CoM biosynthesis protein A)
MLKRRLNKISMNKFLEHIKTLNDDELRGLANLDAEASIQSSEWEGITLDKERVRELTFEQFKEWRDERG